MPYKVLMSVLLKWDEIEDETKEIFMLGEVLAEPKLDGPSLWLDLDSETSVYFDHSNDPAEDLTNHWLIVNVSFDRVQLDEDDLKKYPTFDSFLSVCKTAFNAAGFVETDQDGKPLS